MATSNGYIQEIKSLRKEIRRLNDRLKLLRDQKAVAEGRLYEYMKKNGIEKADGITINSVKPRGERAPRKKKSEKKRDAIELFAEAGVDDPEKFWEEFQATQKYQRQEESDSDRGGKGKGYDPYLGF